VRENFKEKNIEDRVNLSLLETADKNLFHKCGYGIDQWFPNCALQMSSVDTLL
jgi:hypothetical protein